MSANERDASMTHGDQVLGHLLAGAEIVDAHAGHAGLETARRNGHHWDTGGSQLREYDLRLAQRRRQNDSGDALRNLACSRPLGRVAHVVPSVEYELCGRMPCTSKCTHQQLAEVGGAGVGVNQRDASTLRGRQGPRGSVRCVVQLAHGAHDQLARRFPDVAVAVHHARHGHQRDARVPCDFVNGYRIALASLGSCGGLHSHDGCDLESAGRAR